MIIPSRCFLLLVGDDCALLFPPGAMKAAGPVVAASHSDEEAERILLALRERPETPVVILADTNAQPMKVETLPPVSRLDRRKIMARRLEKAFPSHPFKTSLPLGQDRALLMAVDEDGALALWQERLARQPNLSAGIASLPIEAAALMQKLRPETAKGWAMLVLWQRSGGFRQIVTLDGKMVFTRMAAQLPDLSSAQSALGFVAVDIQATHAYLARYGLGAQETPRLTAVVPHALGESFAAIFDGQDCTVLTPHEAALRLGLTPVFSPKEPYCDALCASWIAGRTHFHRLMMKSEERSRLWDRLLRKGGFWFAGGLLLISLALTGTTLVRAAYGFAKGQKLALEIAGLEQELAQTRASLAPATEPLGRLRLAVEKRRYFMAPAGDDLLSLPPLLANALKDEARLDALEWKDNIWTLDIRWTEASAGRSKEEEIALWDALATRLRGALPDYSVTIARYPFAALPEETLTSSSPQGGAARFVLRKEATP